MKRYSASQIRRTLSKYEAVERRLQLVDGVELSVVEVSDAYALLDRMIEQEGRLHRVERFPYWAEVWPSAVALARWAWTGAVEPPRGWALELGCGTGLVGVALALRGWRVVATDFVEDALIFASHNALLNQAGQRHQVAYLDWSNPVGEPVDCIVASDVLYERRNHPYLTRVLRRLLLPGGRFIASDPGRPPARLFVDLLTGLGYRHTCEPIVQAWRSVDHQVDVHTFVRPPE